jgi:hypothetical protein
MSRYGNLFFFFRDGRMILISCVCTCTCNMYFLEILHLMSLTTINTAHWNFHVKNWCLFNKYLVWLSYENKYIGFFFCINNALPGLIYIHVCQFWQFYKNLNIKHAAGTILIIFKNFDHISGVMVGMLAFSPVDPRFEPWSDQTKNNKIGIAVSLLSTQH